ncbi:MAG TPA: aminoacetone oxidase family FAD-binding enzyme, partial [Candidatus Omnitrophota bacterium]|nr:aminoacetone oxidase family FAD-binding enzyme [Candidatus Omnitrophota bacterium]
MQGLTLKNIKITFECDGKKIASDVGELLFTHFGVSGPLVLDMSAQVVAMLDSKKPVYISIDLKPGLTEGQIDNRILRDISEHGSISIRTMLKEMLPVKMVPVFAKLLKLDAAKRINQLTAAERRGIAGTMKSFVLTVTEPLPLEEAMVTCGGIPVKDIDPRTMASRIVPGLYFAGEIIDASAPSGGYNLQQAFSTGYLAGSNA